MYPTFSVFSSRFFTVFPCCRRSIRHGFAQNAQGKCRCPDSFLAWFSFVLRPPSFFMCKKSNVRTRGGAIHIYVRIRVWPCIIYIIRCVQFWGRSDPCGHRVGNPSDLVLGVNRAFFMPVSEVLLSSYPKNQGKGTIFHTFLYGFLAWGINSPYLCTRNRDASNACPGWYAPWRKRLVRRKSDSPVAAIFEMIP